MKSPWQSYGIKVNQKNPWSKRVWGVWDDVTAQIQLCVYKELKWEAEFQEYLD